MKIEFEIQEFEKELNINIVIRKDGEVVCSTSSSTAGNTEKKLDVAAETPIVDEKKSRSKRTTSETPTKSTPAGGNFMGMDF